MRGHDVLTKTHLKSFILFLNYARLYVSWPHEDPATSWGSAAFSAPTEKALGA